MTTEARLAAAITAALLLWGTAAHAACVAQRGVQCLNFDRLPEISQQIVGHEAIAPSTTPQPAGAAAPAPAPYTGPTVGVSRTVRQAPTVGYRWSLQ